MEGKAARVTRTGSSRAGEKCEECTRNARRVQESAREKLGEEKQKKRAGISEIVKVKLERRA